MTNWDEAPLGELLEVLIDHRGKTPKKVGGADFTPSGVPVVSAIHIKGGRINWHERERYVPRWMFEKWMPVRLRRGDVLLTSEAPLGQVAQVETDDDLVLSQRLFALRGKSDRLDSTYLRYFLETPAGQERLLSRASGTTVVGIRQAELVKIKVPLPPLNEQRRIAAVLGALDDLIETNRALVESLGEQARYVAAQSRALVPLSSFAKSASTRQVKPVGWVEHYSLPAFDSGATPERIDGSMIHSNKLDIREPSVLVSRLNPKWERCWLVYPIGRAVASTEFVPLGGVDAQVEEVWAVTSAPAYWRQMREHVTGTTGSHQRVDKSALLDLLVPDVRALPTSVRSGVVALVRTANHMRDEIVDLTRTRDELLPLLMSGQVRVEDVEEAA